MNINESVETKDSRYGGADYALRKCSFEPKDHLINLEKDTSKSHRLYLTVEWRVYWFQTWCQENNKSYLIEEQPVEMVPGTNFIQSRCTVYIDGEAVGNGIGGINLNGSKGGEYCIQSCATIAKGRALANAGFGSVFSSALDSENGADIPCDGGMGTDFFLFKPQRLGPDDGNPLTTSDQINCCNNGLNTVASSRQNPSELFGQSNFKFASQMPRSATTIPVTPNCPKTKEEALNFPVTLKGQWSNKPLREVLEKDPDTVRWFAQKSRDGDLMFAAKLVLDLA